MYFFVFSLGRAVVRPKSAGKCTAWSAGTNGAPPAAGRKPVSGSQTKLKDFGRQGRIPIFFLSSNYFLHCRGSLFSLFYFFLFSY